MQRNRLVKWGMMLIGSAALLLPTDASAASSSSIEIHTKKEVFWFKKLSNKNPAYTLYIEQYNPYDVNSYIVPDKKRKNKK